MTMLALGELPPCPRCGATQGVVGWSPDQRPTHETRACACDRDTGWCALLAGQLTVLGADLA